MIVSDVASGFGKLTEEKVNDLLDRLDRAYPQFNGWWRIAVNEAGGILTVTNVALSNKAGFHMHLSKLDPEGRKVVQYAGELLERYRISRSKYADIWSEIANGKRDFRGELAVDAG